MPKFPLQLELANGKQVELTGPEFQEFITDRLLPNPDWHHSHFLDKDEVSRYLQNKATVADLHKIIRYILIYQENLTLTAYLFSKVDSQKNADDSKEYNMAYLKRIRGLRSLDTTEEPKLLTKIARKMESLCMEVGADPL